MSLETESNCQWVEYVTTWKKYLNICKYVKTHGTTTVNNCKTMC